ncbi:MAG: YtxH domain-containing protein [Nitrososphaeraceae archaeon]|nr:YtxH domain-containing protein [Nitrososphaeraceae archaeon]
MSSTKKNDIKENTSKLKDTTDKYLEQQKQQVQDTIDDVSETTTTINENANKIQTDNQKVFEKNVDTFRKYQEEIVRAVQEISNNATEVQKNFFNTYQSSYIQFLDNTFRSHWQNFNIPERYSETYDTMSKNMQDGTINVTNIINEITVGGIEHFSKSIELTQRYYNDILQNNVNYAKKIERTYNR